MTDQCGNCTLKGDLKACQEASCFHHENWYAIQLNNEIQRWKDIAEDCAVASTKAKACEILEAAHNAQPAPPTSAKSEE